MAGELPAFWRPASFDDIAQLTAMKVTEAALNTANPPKKAVAASLTAKNAVQYNGMTGTVIEVRSANIGDRLTRLYNVAMSNGDKIWLVEGQIT